MELPVDVTSHHLWTAHLQFVALASHILNQHSQLQFTASRNHNGLRVRRFVDLDADVSEHFAAQTFTEVTASEELALLACHR